jgi:hypothetical protein
VPLGGGASLTLSAEARLRYDAIANARLAPGDDYGQTLFRGTPGADLRLDRRLRVYGEVATGRVGGLRDDTGPNFRNAASVQQLLVEVRDHVGGVRGGAMVGRQEFADGPRQLVSVSDGSNVHRTWNGVRLYVHGRRLRAGAFDLHVTRLGPRGFDETVDRAERMSGINASAACSIGISRGAPPDP